MSGYKQVRTKRRRADVRRASGAVTVRQDDSIREAYLLAKGISLALRDSRLANRNVAEPTQEELGFYDDVDF